LKSKPSESAICLTEIHFFGFGFVLIIWIFLPLLKIEELVEKEEVKEVEKDENQ